MKLKNFIKVNVDENKYGCDGQLIFKKESEPMLVNIKFITYLSENFISLSNGRMIPVMETAEQIQQKILECQDYDFINSVINGEGTEENVKCLKPEHQEIIKPYNNPDTERNINEF